MEKALGDRLGYLLINDQNPVDTETPHPQDLRSQEKLTLIVKERTIT